MIGPSDRTDSNNICRHTLDQVWPGWQSPGGGGDASGGGEGPEGSQRLLMGRTLAALRFVQACDRGDPAR